MSATQLPVLTQNEKNAPKQQTQRGNQRNILLIAHFWLHLA